jgi:hypothetical protein
MLARREANNLLRQFAVGFALRQPLRYALAQLVRDSRAIVICQLAKSQQHFLGKHINAPAMDGQGDRVIGQALGFFHFTIFLRGNGKRAAKFYPTGEDF